MTVAISTSADAVGAGWSFIGPIYTGHAAAAITNPTGRHATATTAWYAEKPVQCGGKLVCTAPSTSSLVTAIAQAEIDQGSFGTHSPENTSFPGHV